MPSFFNSETRHSHRRMAWFALFSIALFFSISAKAATFEEVRAKAEQNDAKAQFSLGMMYGNGRGVTQDYAEAVKWFRKAAEQGHAPAQRNLGRAYAEGWGVARDRTEAARWYQKAADQGLASAQRELLRLEYEKGLGVVQDDVETAKRIRKAAEQKSVESELELMMAHIKGLGVEYDEMESAKRIRKAAEQNDARAQFFLGGIYARGLDEVGMAQNDVEAIRWFRKAAEQNDAMAQFALGKAYAYGLGVPQDYAEALKWYRKAADQGLADARNRIAEVTAAQKKYVSGDGNNPGPLAGTWRVEPSLVPITFQFRSGEMESMGVIVKVSYEFKWDNSVIVTHKDGASKGTGIRFTFTGPDTLSTPLSIFPLHRDKPREMAAAKKKEDVVEAAQEQVDFEEKVARLQTLHDQSSYNSSGRKREAAREAYLAFEKELKNNYIGTYQKDWVCKYTDHYPWDPVERIDTEHKKVSVPYCEDVKDRSHYSKFSIEIEASNLEKIPKLYTGDIISISGKVSCLNMTFNGYDICFEDATIRIIKQGN